MRIQVHWCQAIELTLISLTDVQHLLNSATRFCCPQAFLSVELQFRDDVCEVKKALGTGKKLQDQNKCQCTGRLTYRWMEQHFISCITAPCNSPCIQGHHPTCQGPHQVQGSPGPEPGLVLGWPVSATLPHHSVADLILYTHMGFSPVCFQTTLNTSANTWGDVATHNHTCITKALQQHTPVVNMACFT